MTPRKSIIPLFLFLSVIYFLHRIVIKQFTRAQTADRDPCPEAVCGRRSMLFLTGYGVSLYLQEKRDRTTGIRKNVDAVTN